MKQAGCYEIQENIGKGAQASVVMAQHVITKKRVALKIFNLSEEYHQRGFYNEASCLTQLQNCANIIRIYEHFTIEKRGVVVLEEMQNDLLDVVLHSTISEKTAINYFHSICKAVKFMHDLNIGHLDIKLENCLINGNIVKLCDFGNSVIFHEGQRFKGRRGTIGYVCPEIMEGNPFCPKQADMWSLGITFYLLLTGCFPFNEGETFLADDFLDHAKISPMSRNLLGYLLEVNPERRYNIHQTISHPIFQTESKRRTNTFQLFRRKLGNIFRASSA